MNDAPNPPGATSDGRGSGASGPPPPGGARPGPEHDLLRQLRVLVDDVLDRVERAALDHADHRSAEDPTSGDRTSGDRTAADGPDAPTAGASAGEDATAPGTAPSGCSWCPVCALSALARGEHHDLVARLARELAAIVALLRELLARWLPMPGAQPRASEPETPPRSTSSFVPISVTRTPGPVES